MPKRGNLFIQYPSNDPQRSMLWVRIPQTYSEFGFGANKCDANTAEHSWSKQDDYSCRK
jgi:hypothetical protein